MTVAAFKGGYTMDAAVDELDNATVGDAQRPTEPFMSRINKIHLVRNEDAGTAVTSILEGGSGGVEIIRRVDTSIPITNTQVINFDGQDIADLHVATITEGVTVVVFVE